MQDIYKKYIKYKMKYLNLINNINGGQGTPIKRYYSVSETPEFPNQSSSKKDVVDKNEETEFIEKELIPISPYDELEITEKTIPNIRQSITPSKDTRRRLYANTPDRISRKTALPITIPKITPSKDVNKNKLIKILDTPEIHIICENRNFRCFFEDKRKKGDGCVLELHTPPLPGDDFYNVGHITVHIGESKSAAKSFHYKSDDFSKDGVKFNLIITAMKNEEGKYLLFGNNSITGKMDGFHELKTLYYNKGFGDLGERIENVVIDIIGYLNSRQDDIFYDPR